MTPRRETHPWFANLSGQGDQTAAKITLSESYSGADIQIPVFVWKGPKPGPTVAITAAVHGDEINGTGTIRKILRDEPFHLSAGTLLLVPVVNILGFEQHSRYLPDRRDLNRAFPGSRTGSLAARLANSFFRRVIKHCDYCIDLHTAAVRRTNFPNVRADMSDPDLAEFARAFGAELIMDNKGPKGSLRVAACKAGCKTLILEAGEVWKVEPTVVEYATHGITNCLKFLKMVEGEPVKPAYRLEVDATRWVRASNGGFLEFHVAPGDIVEKGEAIATNTDLLGESQNVISAPREGIILGMTTMPAVAPGDAICHIAYAKTASLLRRAGRAIDKMEDEHLHERMREDLSRSILVTDSEEE